MDDPRDLTLADLAALRDLYDAGDGDVFDALVGVEIPERFQLSDASQELSDFLTLFLRRRLPRRPPPVEQGTNPPALERSIPVQSSRADAG